MPLGRGYSAPRPDARGPKVTWQLCGGSCDDGIAWGGEEPYDRTIHPTLTGSVPLGLSAFGAEESAPQQGDYEASDDQQCRQQAT